MPCSIRPQKVTGYVRDEKYRFERVEAYKAAFNPRPYRRGDRDE